jgi:hypothetical protein
MQSVSRCLAIFRLASFPSFIIAEDVPHPGFQYAIIISAGAFDMPGSESANNFPFTLYGCNATFVRSTSLFCGLTACQGKGENGHGRNLDHSGSCSVA